jgi:hypothetical protein
MGFDEVRALVEAHGLTFQIEPRCDDGSSLIASVSAIISATDDETYDTKIASKVRNSKHIKFVARLLQGRIETLKQACVYVDIDGNGSFSDPSKAIDRAMTDKLLKLASGAVYSTKQMLRRYNKGRARRAAASRPSKK